MITLAPPSPNSAAAAVAVCIAASGHRLGLDEDIIQRLIEAKEVIRLRLSPKLSDGRVHNLAAFVVRHSDLLGPSKGGSRVTPDVDEDTVRALAPR